MEHRKNKKIVFVVMLLLVSVIGISFSYFTASTTRNNLTTSNVDTTVTIDNTEFIIEGKLAINDLNILPGHKSVSSIKVTARGDHTINYNLIWDGINSLERLDYKVYKTTEEIVPTTTCRRITEEGNGLTKYYEECNITNITELGEVISSGSINKNTEITKEVLKSNESITATKEGETVYYYVVLEFPNLDKDQNIDMNSKFEGEITVESDEVKLPMNVSKVLSKYTKDNSRSGEITAGFKESTPTTVYSKEDDDGTSYVFAGVNPNNWVKLGNLYFRIIRFNGDGTMRLIYSGKGSPATSGTDTQIGRSEFNNSNNDNAYIGYMYGSEGQYSYNETHKNTQDSTIKKVLDIWYINNLSNYSKIIDVNAGFCNDRNISTISRRGYGKLGYGKNATIYVALDRYTDASFNIFKTVTPSLKCSSNDLFTPIESTKGNKKLSKPIGLITADEYMLAGGGGESSNANTVFWLNTKESYWTMTPSYFTSNKYAWMFYVISTGYLTYGSGIPDAKGVRPVINLKSSTTFTNNGTGDPGSSTNPYEVVVT